MATVGWVKASSQAPKSSIGGGAGMRMPLMLGRFQT
jgi:hypothetical protein